MPIANGQGYSVAIWWFLASDWCDFFLLSLYLSLSKKMDSTWLIKTEIVYFEAEEKNRNPTIYLKSLQMMSVAIYIGIKNNVTL